MVYPLTITASAMRDINRSAILEIIRRDGPIARTTIAKRLDVSLPTVMRIVDTLIEEGFVRLQGGSEWTGGRRRPLLEFNAEALSSSVWIWAAQRCTARFPIWAAISSTK